MPVTQIINKIISSEKYTKPLRLFKTGKSVIKKNNVTKKVTIDKIRLNILIIPGFLID
jgi:hypothetical protein